MVQRQVGIGKQLEGLLCWQHCLGWLTAGVVKQTVHDKGWCVTCCEAQHCLGDVTEGVMNQNTCTGPVRDLYRHAQHCYSTTLSHVTNCCVRYKPIWTVSCISHNISHCPCCQLAVVVDLCSRPFNVKLSVRLPSSCNAAPLIAKATTHLKEVSFRQPIRRYLILCCYSVSRPVCWMSSCRRGQYIQ